MGSALMITLAGKASAASATVAGALDEKSVQKLKIQTEQKPKAHSIESAVKQ